MAGQVEVPPRSASTPPHVAPSLRISPRQRNVVRAAATPYKGSTVRILIHRSSSGAAETENRRAEYDAFARGLATALEEAGIEVETESVETLDLGECPHVPGIRVRYGASRSGAVYAIAESFFRAGIVTESVSGCSVAQDDEFTFILSPAAS